MIWVRVQHLPADSALVTELRDGPVWSLSDFLLDDIRVALGHEPHPLRPRTQKRRLDPTQIAAGQQRRAERRRAIEAGQIT